MITADRTMRDDQADRIVLKYVPEGGTPFWVECVAQATTPDTSAYDVTVERIGKAAPVTLRLVTLPDDVYRTVVANLYDHLRRQGLDIGMYRGRGAAHVRFTESRATAALAAVRKSSPYLEVGK